MAPTTPACPGRRRRAPATRTRPAPRSSAYPRSVDAFRGPIKAGVAALFAVGLLLLFLNPPSLSGASGMAVFAGGGLALALLTAWAFVAMTGSDAMPEREFERLVRRSEELARQPDLQA